MSESERVSRRFEYLKLYNAGFTIPEIASHFGVNRSTVSRVMSRARRKYVCPFSSECRECPLSECAFKPEYRELINQSDHLPNRRRSKSGERVEKHNELEVSRTQETPHDKPTPDVNPVEDPVIVTPDTTTVEELLPKDTPPIPESKPAKKRGRPRKYPTEDLTESNSPKIQRPRKKKELEKVVVEKTSSMGQPEPIQKPPVAIKEESKKHSLVEAKSAETHKPESKPVARQTGSAWRNYPKKEPVKKITKTPDGQKPEPKVIVLPPAVPKERPKPPITPPPPKPAVPDRREPRATTFTHRALMMTDGEIRQSYRLAKDQNLQIEILAQLNGCSEGLIMQILGL